MSCLVGCDHMLVIGKLLAASSEFLGFKFRLI